LRQLHEQYGGRAQFLFVYIREAGHVLPDELREFAEPADAPRGSQLRLLPRIRAGRKHFDLRFPCLLDNEAGEVEKRYNAFPMRVFIVDSAGRIAVDSGITSADLFPWKKMTDWLERHGVSHSPQSAEKRG